MEALKNKTKMLLIKRGNNEEEVNKMIKEHFDFIVSSYGHTRPSEIANTLIYCY